MTKKQLYERIGSSLRHGIVFTKKWYITIHIYICFVMAIPLSSTAYLVEGAFNPAYFTDMDTLCVMAYANIVAFICLGIAIVPLVIKNKLKRKIFMWLDDAVELDAKTEEIDREYTKFLLKTTKLKVEFQLNGQHVVLTSEQGNNKNPWFSNYGYRRDLTKYANKKVKILYSQKYSEVLILKNKYQLIK